MPDTATINGQEFVLVPRAEYNRLAKLDRLPVLPGPLPNGNYPYEYGRILLARKLILRREALGWSQAEAARQAGIPNETLCRLETGKTTPSTKTVDKLDAAYSAAEAASKKKPVKRKRISS